MIKEIPYCESCQVLKLTCFSFFNPDDVSELKYEKSCSLYRRGQMIFQEDNRAMGIYCLHEGKIKLFKLTFDGKEQIVRFILPGELFGLRSIIGVKYYGINSQAIEDSIACFYSADTFVQLLNKFPQLSRRLIFSLSNLLNEAEEKMTSMAHKPVKERLAEALVHLSRKFHEPGTRDHFSINLSREDLANMIGSATETVIRLLSELKDEKLIQIDGRKINILDSEKLCKTANLSGPPEPFYSVYQDPAD